MSVGDIERLNAYSTTSLSLLAHSKIPMEGRSFDDIPVDLDSTAERPAVTEQMLDAMRPQFMTPVYIPPDELLDKSR